MEKEKIVLCETCHRIKNLSTVDLDALTMEESDHIQWDGQCDCESASAESEGTCKK